MAKETKRKTYVFDTNVILHDWKSIYNFEEHDIVISTEVLKELDTFKKGTESRHYNARHFIGAIDNLRKEKIEKGGKQISKLSNDGVSLGKGLGLIRIVLFIKHTKTVGSVFSERTVDNSLLTTTNQIQKDNPHREVILVTKDVNVRLKADALNILSEDYKRDQLKDVDNLPKGRILIQYTSLNTIIDLVYSKKVVSYENLETKVKSRFKNNNYAILKGSGKKSILVKIDKQKKELVQVEKLTKFGITPKNAEQVFAMDAVLDEKTKLITLFGPAGTGKTLMAMVAALELLKQKRCKRIIISAAIVPVDNKDIGFLPGDMIDKISPYMRGIYDNISLIKSHVQRNGDQTYLEIFNSTDGENLEIQPLSFIRGRSINDAVFIVDEAQNTTPHEMLTTITRAGQNTKIVLCGDIKQVDAPYLGQSDNGLVHVISRFQGQAIYVNVFLEKGERSELATLGSQLLG